MYDERRIQHLLDTLEEHYEAGDLTDWEASFFEGMMEWEGDYTDKQVDKMEEIVKRIFK